MSKRPKYQFCSTCAQFVSKATYYRHLTPGVCPGKTDHDDETNVDQNFEATIDADAPTAIRIDEEIEVIENMEDYCDGDNSWRHENEVNIEEPSPPSPVVEFFNKFLIFFQLKFNLPERGLQLLLQFFLAFMTLICKRNGNGSAMGIKDELPTSVYMIRKQSSMNKQFIQYCICTECETLYGMDQCIVQKTCTHIRFPNHPQKKSSQCLSG